MKKLLTAALLFSAMSAPAIAGWHDYWYTNSNNLSFSYDISNLGGAAMYTPSDDSVTFTTGNIATCQSADVKNKVDGRTIAFKRFVSGRLCVYKPQSKSDEDYIVNQFKSKQVVTWQSYNIPAKGFDYILKKNNSKKI
ncbi:hypothetical protein M9194_00320 [Vibrio sp. S4M6]|uniref:hypothetical protein n=1 Tax=Vibrio sinus TaxID=2946865 RepID=UPI002029BD3C|nr:hypothetical protein [Vibrio sinus]MCL9779876.1 hypothetical protein [Vibrio sinus]